MLRNLSTRLRVQPFPPSPYMYACSTRVQSSDESIFKSVRFEKNFETKLSMSYLLFIFFALQLILVLRNESSFLYQHFTFRISKPQCRNLWLQIPPFRLLRFVPKTGTLVPPSCTFLFLFSTLFLSTSPIVNRSLFTLVLLDPKVE